MQRGSSTVTRPTFTGEGAILFMAQQKGKQEILKKQKQKQKKNKNKSKNKKQKTKKNLPVGLTGKLSSLLQSEKI